MTFVVTDNCRGCRYTDCVLVCPVDCFHGDEEMLYIDPARCIDCGACIPECPVEAIYEEGTVPAELADWLAINAERAPKLPVINQRSEPLPTAATRARELGFLPIDGL
jgi:ferredoxin